MRRQALDAQSAAVTLALRRAARSPTVSASGSVSLATWSIGISGKIPLVDSGLSAAEVREAEIAVEQARLDAERLVETVTTEVTAAVADLKDLAARVELATARRDLSRAWYELAQTKLVPGGRVDARRARRPGGPHGGRRRPVEGEERRVPGHPAPAGRRRNHRGVTP